MAETPPTLLEQGRETAEVLFSNAFALLGVLWLLGVVVVIGYFFVQLGYLYWFRNRQKRTGRDGHAIIYETQSGSLPFSFGRNANVSVLRNSISRGYT